jgi:hypothetical protein
MEFPRETATVKFDEETPWPGVEVEVYIDTSLSFFMWVQGASDRLQKASLDRLEKIEANPNASDQEVEELKELNDFNVRFGDEILASWLVGGEVLEWRGVEVPCTGQGLVTLPVKFGGALMVAWTQAVSEVSGPLVAASPNGNKSQAAPTKKVARSRSRGSSKGRS